MIAPLLRSSKRVVDWIAPPVEVPRRRRCYHRMLWVLKEVIAVHFLVTLPSEFLAPVGLLVALILVSLLPAFR